MSTPPVVEPGLERLVGFGRLLRRRGLPVGTGRILTFCRAVAVLDRLDRDGVYWAGRVAMVARKEDLAAYDADRKSTRLNSSHWITSRMPSSA